MFQVFLTIRFIRFRIKSEWKWIANQAGLSPERKPFKKADFKLFSIIIKNYFLMDFIVTKKFLSRGSHSLVSLSLVRIGLDLFDLNEISVGFFTLFLICQWPKIDQICLCSVFSSHFHPVPKMRIFQPFRPFL